MPSQGDDDPIRTTSSSVLSPAPEPAEPVEPGPEEGALEAEGVADGGAEGVTDGAAEE